MSIDTVVTDIFINGITYGLIVGGSIFLIGLGINLCLKLFNS